MEDDPLFNSIAKTYKRAEVRARTTIKQRRPRRSSIHQVLYRKKEVQEVRSSAEFDPNEYLIPKARVKKHQSFDAELNETIQADMKAVRYDEIDEMKKIFFELLKKWTTSDNNTCNIAKPQYYTKS